MKTLRPKSNERRSNQSAVSNCPTSRFDIVKRDPKFWYSEYVEWSVRDESTTTPMSERSFFHARVQTYQACLSNKNFSPALVASMYSFFVKLQWHRYGLVAMIHPAYRINLAHYPELPLSPIFPPYPWFLRSLSSYCSKSCWSFLPKSSNRICCSCSSNRRFEAHKAFLDDDWSLKKYSPLSAIACICTMNHPPTYCENCCSYSLSLFNSIFLEDSSSSCSISWCTN